MSTEKKDVMLSLRRATSENHKRVEEVVDASPRFASRENYCDYLDQILRLFRGYEEALGKLPWDKIAFDFESRRKVKYIEQDLQKLGITNLQKGEMVSCPEPESLASGLGFLYVLEGSTLGGRVLLGILKKYGIDVDSGGSFFSCYGSNTDAMWSRFKETASTYCHTQERIDEACRAAVFAFEHYRLNIRPIPTP